MKTKTRWSLWLRGLLALMVAVCCASCAKSAETLWQEQYDLGVRYFSGGNYEDAIIAFTAAIEIEPNKAAAFIGRGDTYAALAKQESDSTAAQALWEKAYADYEQARELGDTQAGEKLERSRDILQQLQKEQAAQLLLEVLYTRFANGDTEGAKALMRQTDYMALSITASQTPYYYDHGDGTGVGAYPGNFYYYGHFENGLRNGQGLWICAYFGEDSIMESYIYEGTWVNDRPNGEGHIVDNRYPDKVQEGEGIRSTVKEEITGTFADGLYHGTIYEVWYEKNGSVITWYPITAINGVYQVMEENHAIIAEGMVVTPGQNDMKSVMGNAYGDFVHAIKGFNS